MNDTKNLEYIPIDKIIPSSYQEKISIDDDLTNLTSSIKKYGLIKPVILRKEKDKYEVIEGKRRIRSLKQLKKTQIPSFVLNISKLEALELLLTEKKEEKPLLPLEEAKIYEEILKNENISIKKLSQKLSLEEKNIEEKLSLLKLNEEAQQAFIKQKISLSQAYLLAKVSYEKQKLILKKIIENNLSLEELEKMIDKEFISFNDLISKEKRKKGVNKMDNNQFNFNQYNNLLKEQPKQEMYNSNEPSAIIENQMNAPTQNNFFPSLEDQPLNLEVPFTNQEQVNNLTNMAPTPEPITPSMPMPDFVTPTNMAPTPEPVTPSMPMPEFITPTNMAPTPEPVTPSMPIPEFVSPTNMAPTPEPVTPSMPMPEFVSPTNMAPTPEPVTPSMPMPDFVSQANTSPAPEPTTKVKVDVMPAVNMIRNLIPLLETSGYKILIEEKNNPGDYEITIKIEQ